MLPLLYSGRHASSHFRGGRFLVFLIVVCVCTWFGRHETSGKGVVDVCTKVLVCDERCFEPALKWKLRTAVGPV